MDTITLVKILGTLFCTAVIIICLFLSRKRFNTLSTSKSISLDNIELTVSSFWKLKAFISFIILPILIVSTANYYTFSGTKEVGACAKCHIMLPMLNDMINPKSNSLAARHYKNHWINHNQCYECHSDYGLNGTIQAKMEGFRHLARYTTKFYTEPIKMRGNFKNDNCLKCHRGTPKFERVTSHKTAKEQLYTNSISCLNCHGIVHPTSAQRTPGSKDYSKLMEAISSKEALK